MGDGYRVKMAERVPWLRPVDYDIFEWLSLHDEVEIGFVANPSTIAANIEFNNRYVANRCKLLSEAGFLKRTEGPKYALDDLAVKVIESELSEGEAPSEPGSGE